MRMTAQREDTLYVRMLGGFSMHWNDRLILGGAKGGDSQSGYLVQILIHNRENGISRDRLEELLFEGKDMNDPHHALQSVIYNAKKKLEKAGLPKCGFIEQRKGVFYWTDELPMELDTAVLERLYREAAETKDPDERLALYMDACYTYTGEFLPNLTATIWAAREARRYREIFCACVERATELLRMNQDFSQMEELGIYASRIDPLADWETVTMEALASLGRYEEARRLYDETVQYYFAEQGLRPSKKLMEQFERLGARMQHQHAALDQIQMELSGQFDDFPGGYTCSYPVFQGIYRMVERMMERGGQSVYLMLCTVVDGKGNPMKEGAMLEELSQRLCDAVRHSIRRGDAMCRYGPGQCLVLLVNTTRENCSVIQKRINYRVIVGRQRSGIQYYVNSLFWQPQLPNREQKEAEAR